jgi:hypothetical protein
LDANGEKELERELSPRRIAVVFATSMTKQTYHVSEGAELETATGEARNSHLLFFG